MKRFLILVLTVLLVFGLAGALFAAEAYGDGVKKATGASVDVFAMSAIAAAIGLGLAALGCGIGQGIATGKAAEAASHS